MSINRNFMTEAATTKVLAHASSKCTVNLHFLNHSTDTDADLTMRRVLKKDVGVTGINITNEGSAYVTMPTIALTAPGGDGTTATADARIGVNAIASFGNAGTGYQSGDILTADDGGNAVEGATITVTDVDGSGVIQSATVTTAGSFDSLPTMPMALSGGNGSGATASFTFKVVGAVVTDAGSGYGFTPPTVTIDGTATGEASTGPTLQDYQKIENAFTLKPGEGTHWRAIALEAGDMITAEGSTATIGCNAWGIDGL